MDETRRPVVEKTEKGIIWTDGEGKQHEFQRPIRTLYIEVVELHARHSLERYGTEDESEFDEPLEESFSAGGHLSDKSIEVLGFPESRSRAVSIQFDLLTAERAKKLTGLSIDHKLRPASLWFTPGDLELDSQDTWEVACPLPPAQFNKLAHALASSQIKKLTMGLEFQDIYVDDWHAPPSVRVGWLVPPNQDSSRGGSSRCFGYLTQLNLETPALDLRQPEESEEPKLALSPEPNPDFEGYQSIYERNAARSLELIYANVGMLLKPLTLIGWALVAVAVVLLVRGH